jgi:hypothetical protein
VARPCIIIEEIFMEKTEKHSSKLLVIDVREDDSRIYLDWKGRSKDKNPAYFLTPILTKALDKSKRENKDMVMDFRHLEYMNSSTITPIIKILERVKNGQSKVNILYDKTLKWQELTFCALEVFQTEDHRIVIEAK